MFVCALAANMQRIILHLPAIKVCSRNHVLNSLLDGILTLTWYSMPHNHPFFKLQIWLSGQGSWCHARWSQSLDFSIVSSRLSNDSRLLWGYAAPSTQEFQPGGILVHLDVIRCPQQWTEVLVDLERCLRRNVDQDPVLVAKTLEDHGLCDILTRLSNLCLSQFLEVEANLRPFACGFCDSFRGWVFSTRHPH